MDKCTNGRTDAQTDIWATGRQADRLISSPPYLNDYQQQLSRVQLEEEPQARQHIHEASPVMLASGAPVVPGGACTEEGSQVQKQQLRHQQQRQPC